MIDGHVEQTLPLQVRPLVVNTEPYPGECLSSVLVRATEANALSRSVHLLSLIGIKTAAPESVPFIHARAACDIAKLLGTSTEAIESRMHPALEGDLRRTAVRWFDGRIERCYLDSGVRRYAPSSLQRQNHVPAIWNVRLLDYCPITMELLSSKCPNCSRVLGWRGCRSLTKCEKCGSSLLLVTAKTLPASLHDFARLGAALISPAAGARHAMLSLPGPIRSWEPTDAFVGLFTLGEAQNTLAKRQGASRPINTAQNIATGMEMMQSWPESFNRFVKESTASYNSAAVRVGLGTLGCLFEGNAKRTPIRDLIRASISDAIAKAQVPSKIFNGGVVDSNSRAGMLSALDAAKRLGVDLRLLRRLEGQSSTFLARSKAKGGTVLYNAEAINNLARTIETSKKPARCASLLGVPLHCISSLLESSILEKVSSIDAEIVFRQPLISTSSLDALYTRLREGSSRVEGICLGTAMRRVGDPNDWATIFKEMLEGGMPYELSESHSGPLVSAITVRADDVAKRAACRLDGPGISGVTVPCEAAAEILGTSAPVVSAAVRTDLLAGSAGLRRYKIPLPSVLQFQRRFVFSEEICEWTGKSAGWIRARLRGAGYEPAAVLHRAMVWERADVENYLRQRQND